LIILFTFFYAFVQVNPEKLAENLQKQGAYIPSVWPGKDTQKYVSKILIRLSTVGAVFLGLVALLTAACYKYFWFTKFNWTWRNKSFNRYWCCFRVSPSS
jgi:preprotein translocase subunit SecY